MANKQTKLDTHGTATYADIEGLTPAQAVNRDLVEDATEFFEIKQRGEA